MPRYARSMAILLVLLSVMAGYAAAAPPSGATPPVTAPASPVPRIALTFPTAKQVPAGMEIIDDSDHSLDDITANFSDPAAARKQFLAWGWQRNHVRAFHASPGHIRAKSKIDGVYISVHVFGSPDSAAGALDSLFGVLAADPRLKEIPIDPLGEYSRALYGTLDYGNEITIYVQQDNLLIRLSASSPSGDPRVEALDILTAMLTT